MTQKHKLLVAENTCKNCLFGKTPLVNTERQSNLVDSALKDDSFFVCHMPEALKFQGEWKGSTNVCCRAFWNQYRNDSLVLRLAQMLKLVKFIKVE